MPRAAKVIPATDLEMVRATRIVPEAIQEEYAAVPADLHRWSAVHAQADQAVRLAELDLESWEAERRLRVMTEWREGNEGLPKEQRERPPTEASTDAIVYADPEYARRRRLVIGLLREKADASAMLEGIRAKKEMLVSLGADLRLEREQDITIRDRARPRRTP
jgi:hypothetical protein